MWHLMKKMGKQTTIFRMNWEVHFELQTEKKLSVRVTDMEPLEVLRQEASKLRLKYGGEELISSLKDGGKTLECFMPLYDNGITVKEYLEQCWGEMYSALTSCQA